MAVSGLGAVPTDGDGLTPYRFDRDRPEPPVSTCDGGCAERFPPPPISDDVRVRGVGASSVAVVDRADGGRQATIVGRPLDRFAGDVVCGDAEGRGLGGVWFAARPDGSKV